MNEPRTYKSGPRYLASKRREPIHHRESRRRWRKSAHRGARARRQHKPAPQPARCRRYHRALSLCSAILNNGSSPPTYSSWIRAHLHATRTTSCANLSFRIARDKKQVRRLAEMKPGAGGAYIAVFAMCAIRAGDPFSRQTHRRDNRTGSWTTAIFQASQQAGASPGCRACSSIFPGASFRSRR